MSRIKWPVSSASDTVSTPARIAPTAIGGAPWVQATPAGFVVSGPWAAVYQMAYLRTQEALAPSRFQKMMEPCWN